MVRKIREYVVMRSSWNMEVSGHRKIGRAKLRWTDVILLIHKGMKEYTANFPMTA